LPLWPAMGLSGLAFALSHLEALAIVILLPVGMFFAWIFHRTGSLLVPIAAHAVFNLVNVLLLRVPV
jgi:membrane protease YdiL (CAAX protease family)